MQVKRTYDTTKMTISSAVEYVANGSDYDRGALEEVAAGHRDLASLVGRLMQTLEEKNLLTEAEVLKVLGEWEWEAAWG